MGEAPETDWFVVIVNGPAARAEVVAGLDGVRDVLLPLVLAGRADAAPDSPAGMLAAIEDPALWAPHGEGDGRPYWHLWVPVEGGSVSVQRLTEPPPQPERTLARTAELRALLADLQALLRTLSGGRAGPG
ncbi:hypothetical protein [Paracraurococcus ruber]|uniref:hypothetical protein n=1 Tax=Paracraurococcus ruber TaxID=77675 RepID=UPI0010578CAB|nr:hypothetical protein [Paracraurococcus ruber]TDG30542.1 hypothetical protein E2C05_14190 [Paracraurococcus ruber]